MATTISGASTSRKPGRYPCDVTFMPAAVIYYRVPNERQERGEEIRTLNVSLMDPAVECMGRYSPNSSS